MKPNALAQIKLTRYRVALPQIESPPINSTERLVALRDTENQMSDFAVTRRLGRGAVLARRLFFGVDSMRKTVSCNCTDNFRPRVDSPYHLVSAVGNKEIPV